MCGIFGMLGRSDHAGLRDAAKTLSHRGPDGFGEWASADGAVYLAHCRLAIIDLSDAGKQPMANADGSIQLTFNGEIYNFMELRKELQAAGHRFRSRTDSEVIIHGYAEWGDEVVTRLRGIFAFGLWDARRRKVLLVRDRVGVKPLFYSIHGGELAFASETRALLSAMPANRSLDIDAMFQFLRHAYVSGPHTIWEGVARMAPGSMLSFDVDSGTSRICKYWQHGDVDPSWTRRTAQEELEQLLGDSVREQLISDVPVGVFLSGGIDSSLITAFAVEASPKINSFFADFTGWSGSERDDAEAASRHLSTRHHVSQIDALGAGLSDEEASTQLFSAFDEPLGDPAILPTWHLAKAIKQHVTVALSGDGGDELFGGYKWYTAVAATSRRELAWGVERMRRSLGIGREWPEGCANQDEYYHLLQCPSFNETELAMLFPQWSSHAASHDLGMTAPGGDPQAQHDQRHWQERDIRTYLVDNNLARVDRASMAHGLEVRVPLLDHRIVELAMSLPAELVAAGNKGKPLLRAIGVDRLPASLVSKTKQGFSFPIERLAPEDRIIGALRNGALLRSGRISTVGLESWLSRPRRSNHAYKLWLLFVLENWARLWLEPTSIRAAA